MRNAVIIVAGGSGTRMGAALPKQFLQINGKAILIHTLEKFLAFDASVEIVLVMHPDHNAFWEKARQKTGFNYPVKIADGGETRFQSVKNGIAMLDGDFLVGVHDAVRPLVSPSVIQRVYDAAAISGSAIPCIPLKESARVLRDQNSFPLDRSAIRLVQTPQVFHASILRKSYETSYKEEFTDDASVVEYAGNRIELVQGDEFNLKITTPEDFEIASILLNPQKPHLH